MTKSGVGVSTESALFGRSGAPIGTNCDSNASDFLSLSLKSNFTLTSQLV